MAPRRSVGGSATATTTMTATSSSPSVAGLYASGSSVTLSPSGGRKKPRTVEMLKQAIAKEPDDEEWLEKARRKYADRGFGAVVGSASGSSEPKAKKRRVGRASPEIEGIRSLDDVLAEAMALNDAKLAKEAKEAPKTSKKFVETRLPFIYDNDKYRASPKAGALWIQQSYNYFPAYLVDFCPAKNASETDMYTVVPHPAAGFKTSADGTLRVKRRKLLFRQELDAAKCSLGDVHSEDKVEAPSDARYRRATSPLDDDAAGGPVSPSEYDSLDWFGQLLHLRPHLLRVINEEYGPAQWRNSGFFNPRRRDKLKERKEAGDIRFNEMAEVVIPELSRWMLRAQRWVEEKRPADAPKEEIDPPSGSERFNALSVHEKDGYIEDVLRTEAIIQLRIRTEGIPKLAQLELERRAAATIPSGIKPAKDIASIPFTEGQEPPSASVLPDGYLRKLIKGKVALASIPSWVPYALSLAYLRQTRRTDVVTDWSLVRMQLMRSREELRKEQNLPRENESKAAKLAREQKEQGKREVWKNERITNVVDYAERSMSRKTKS